MCLFCVHGALSTSLLGVNILMWKRRAHHRSFPWLLSHSSIATGCTNAPDLCFGIHRSLVCFFHSHLSRHPLLSLYLSPPPVRPPPILPPSTSFALTIELVVIVIIGTDGQVEACRLSPGDHAATVALAAMSVMFGLFTCCMACDQCQVASTNQTKIDRCGRLRREEAKILEEVFRY